jgi:uncharacterized membrane protein YfcA
MFSSVDYDSPEKILILCVVALMIGVSKAGFGGGTGILVGPLLALIFPARESVGLMLPLLLACDVVALYPYWKKWDTRNVKVIVPGAVLGIVLGSFALEEISDRWLGKTIGALAIAFALLQIWRDWIVRTDKVLVPDWRTGSLIGLGTGFVSTLSHVGGTLTTMYLIPQRLDPERFVGTTTALYLLVNLGKCPAYIHARLITLDVLARDAPLIPVLVVGVILGVYLNRRVPSTWFSRVVLIAVFATGIKLLWPD